MKFRCSGCDEITDSLTNLRTHVHSNCDNGSGAWVELPEVSPIDPAKLKATHLIGAQGKIDQLLDQFGFYYMGNSDGHGYLEQELENYKGWEIALDIPNGGIFAVDLIHPSGVWGRPTDQEFGYYQGSAIREFARAVIDEVERYLAEVPGQLNLFEARGDRP